jgi:DNA-binding beta-propeller fold protein YncE
MRFATIKRGLRGAAGLLTIAAITAAGTASAAEVPDHQILGSITGERIGPFEQFKDACGVAVDSAGDTYVADYYQNRIVIFNHEEKYLTQIDNVDPAGADGPCDLAVDSSGKLYANEYHRDVVRFTPAQYPPHLGTTYGSRLVIDQAHSTGVTVDPKTDNAYVDDRTYIAVYGPTGEALMNGPNPLRIGEGSLGDSYGVAISAYPPTEGRIYAADAASETVKVFDPTLDLEVPQTEIHGEATQEGHFHLTDTDLAIDPGDGHLYLANNLQPNFEFAPEALIDEFGPTGNYRGPVPRSFANGTPSFLQDAEPSSLAIHESDLYVTSGNSENASVVIFGPPAPFEAELLTVSKTGGGEGTLTSIPGGIGCGPVCVGEFNKGVKVVLKATPAPGSAISGWSGCEEVLSPDHCAVRMQGARAVTAQFEAVPVASASPSSGTAALRSAAASGAPGTSSKPKRRGAQRHHHGHRHRHHRVAPR